MPVRVECCPAFNYAQDKHDTSIVADDSIPDTSFGSPPTSPTGRAAPTKPPQMKAHFHSESLTLDLRYVSECVADDGTGYGPGGLKRPVVDLKKLNLKAKGHLGEGVCCDLLLEEGQAITFVLRTPPTNPPPKGAKPTQAQADALGVPIQSEYLLTISTPCFILSHIRLNSGCFQVKSTG